MTGTLATVTALSGVASTHSSSPARRQAPQSLIIPSIHLRAPVESVSFNKPADSKAPFHWGDVAWYNRGPLPGELGHALIYGHFDSYCCPAAFFLLRTLKKGASVTVVFPGNKSRTFIVRWSASYWDSKLPIKFMYGPSSDRGLLLITCAGAFHPDGTGYDHQLMVYATMPAPPKPPKRPTPKPKPTAKPKPKPKPKPTKTPRPAPTHTPVPTPRATDAPVPESTQSA